MVTIWASRYPAPAGMTFGEDAARSLIGQSSPLTINGHPTGNTAVIVDAVVIAGGDALLVTFEVTT